MRAKGGKALREAPPTPSTPTPPRPGRVGRGRSGSREIVPGAFACPSVCVWGVDAGVWGPHGLGGLPPGSSYPGLPVPGPAALWTPGSRSLGAGPAPAPRRPRARPPGAQAGSCARCLWLRWIVECLGAELRALGVCPLRARVLSSVQLCRPYWGGGSEFQTKALGAWLQRGLALGPYFRYTSVEPLFRFKRV